MSILPNLIFRINGIPTKFPAHYLVDMDNLTLKFLWKEKWPRIANTVLKKKEQSLQTRTTQFHDILQSYRNKGSIISVKEYIPRWNITESPKEMHTYRVNWFLAKVQGNSKGEKKFFNNWCWNNWIFISKKHEPRHRPYTLHKTDLKWIMETSNIKL